MLLQAFSRLSSLWANRFMALWLCMVLSGLSFTQAGFASDDQSVGAVSFVIGQVEIQRAGTTLPLSSGAILKVGDRLVTRNNGHVHLRFVDGALVSLRPSSSLRIFEYQFDAQNPANSQVKFELEQGVVRAISGQAAESAKDKFRLNTPLAAIGVKGTDFVVEANQFQVNAIVNQGAIVLSPFDRQCRMDALGPCATPFSRELSATARGMAITYSMSMPSPQLLPTGQLKGSELLNLASPLGAVTTPTVVAQSTSTSTSAAVQQNRVDASTYSGLNQILDKTATQDSLVWGRWGNPITQDSLTTPFIAALQGRSVTVGDGYYFLFRNELNVPNFLPFQQGLINFNLQNSSAYYLDSSNMVQPASVLGGTLGINFSNQAFSTSLNLQGATSGIQTLNSTGTVNSNTGIFLSNASAGSSSVAGAVSLDTKQAGYVFSLPALGGQFKGATLWGR